MEIATSISQIKAGRFDYLLHFNDNIEKLKQHFRRLYHIRGRIQKSIDAAKRNGELIDVNVQNWIAMAEKILGQAESFLLDEVVGDKSCLKGWCMNITQRYKFGKELITRTMAICELEHPNFQNVSRPASYTGDYIPESRQSIMMKILEALNDDNVHIIGVCGMCGVGKTTLVKEIGRQAKVANIYDSVVMTVVSQTPSILKIEAEIAETLGLNLLADFESTRADSLWERIKSEKRLLLILDDIWGRTVLDKIGIPSGKNHGGCKFILTSRSRDLCNQMDCQRIFVVECLSKQESWVLFKELVGSNAENSDISSIARNISANCGGLPIVIATVAKALKNETKHVWIDAARKLRKSIPTNMDSM